MTAAQRKAAEPNAAPPRQLFPPHTTIPKGCIAYPVPDGAHFPFLSTGDMAIIDKGQRKLVRGGLFLVQQTSNQRLWQINHTRWGVRSNEQCWDLSPMNRPSIREALAEAEEGDCPTVELPDGR